MEPLNFISEALGHIPGCIFHRATGLYCPGCGGTRALEALFSGDIASSFYYHPLVLYMVFFVIYVLVQILITLVRYRSLKGNYRFPDALLWGALLVLAVNLVIKDGALVFFNIDLLA